MLILYTMDTNQQNNSLVCPEKYTTSPNNLHIKLKLNIFFFLLFTLDLIFKCFFRKERKSTITERIFA